MTEKGLIYLASPYSHSDPRVREERFKGACLAASILMHEGLYIFSPIAHTHSIVSHGSLPHGWEYWAGYDRCILSKCSLMIILMLADWEKSAGIVGETEICRKAGITVNYVMPGEVLTFARDLAGRATEGV